jgi:hypothetical protein
MDSGVLSTDSLEHVAAHVALKAIERISAQNINAVGLDQIVGVFFDLNRCFCVALRPQQRRNLSASCNPGSPPLRGLCRCQKKATEPLQKASWIKGAGNHERRERVRRIQCGVSALFRSRRDVQAFGL